MSRCFALLAVAMLALTLVSPAARAMPPAPPVSTIAVTTELAVNDAQDGKCSITEAFQSALNGNGQPYNECSAGTSPVLIQFAREIAAKPIVLTSSLNINSSMDVAIVGPAIISGNGATRIFDVTNGILSIASVILQDGKTGAGAAIAQSGGRVNIAGVSFTNNIADTGDGGAINNAGGKLSIVGSNFAGNKASAGSGGAIFSTNLSSDVKIAGSTFAGNSARGRGGAISISSTNQSVTEIADVSFAGNIATAGNASADASSDGGGAIFNTGSSTLSVVRGVFNGNLSPFGSGGAIFNGNDASATAVISDTSFNGNLAGLPSAISPLGGAIYNQANLSVARVTMLNNAVAGSGGAIANDRGAVLHVANTLFTANTASGDGGGLYNFNTQGAHGPPFPQATLLNATLSSNTAGGQGGAIFNGPSQGPLTLGNTIVDGSAGGNCQGALVSLGHNLDSAATCYFSQPGDLSGADPKLDIPFFNGGPIASLLTQKLKPGSAAIDAGDPAFCSAAPVDNEDQRGVARPKDGDGNGVAVCDIGAFEGDTIAAGYGSTPVQPGPIDFGSSTVGGPALDASITVFETGNGQLMVDHPVLGGANPGDFGVDPNLSLTISDGGPAQNVPLTCTPTAFGLRTATLTLSTNDPGKPRVTYTLICAGAPTPIPGFGSTPAAPGPVDFGAIRLGSSANANISVFEIGSATLTVHSPVLGGANPSDFGVDPNLFLTLNDGDPPQTIPLACTPTALGIRTATLTLSTNDSSKPTVAYNLSCTAVPIPPPVLVIGGTAPVAPAPALVNPYGVAISPDGNNVYTTGSSSGAVYGFSRDPASGQLTAPQTLADPDLAGAHLVTVSPDGRNVYATGSTGPAGGAIFAFNRDINTGQLTTNSSIRNGDTYICNTNPLMFCPIPGLTNLYGVVVSPDGKHIYLTSNSGGDGGAVVVLLRGASGGVSPTFGYIQTIDDSNAYGARGLAISPDGRHVYVTSYTSSANGRLTIYSRDSNTGMLAEVQTITNCTTLACSISGSFVDGLNGAFQATVSSDGSYVYAVGAYDGAVVAFRRNPIDGKLTYLADYKNDIGGVTGLAGVSGVAISPNGRLLYASSYGAGGQAAAVAVFDRDPLTGLLVFNHAVERTPASGAGGVPPLDGAREIAASPDGANVYTAAYLDSALVRLDIANPAPAIELLRPGSARAGDPALTLYVEGQGFMPTSQVQWNGSSRATTYVNSHLLKADISAADISVAELYPAFVPVTVVNPAPGGGASNVATFTIVGPFDNPAPALERISPPAAPAGGAAFTLVVAGASFLPGSTVQWNGQGRPTTYITANTLKAQISAADIAQPGLAGVTVVSPGPGGGISNALPFTIVGPGANPIPSIARIDPPSIPAASATAFTLTVVGAGFLEGSRVQWNGEDRPTTYVSSAELRAIVPATDITAAGTAGVTVRNPGPGGGDSNAATFTIAGFGDNPVPAARGLRFAPGSGGTWTLIVDGGGFIPGSKIEWNGQDRQTVFISGTQLNAIVSIDDFNRAAVVTVVSPAPGGGASNELLHNPQRLYVPLAVR